MPFFSQKQKLNFKTARNFGYMPFAKDAKPRSLIQNMLLFIEDKNKEFGIYHNIPFVSNYRIFDPLLHSIIPKEIPAIHQAIFAGDSETLKYLLDKEPECVRQLDPWGINAYELARKVGPFDIYDIVIKQCKNWKRKIGSNHYSNRYKLLFAPCGR